MNFNAILGEFSISVKALNRNVSFFRCVNITSCHHVNGLEFLVFFMHFDIQIESDWQYNIDFEIKQIRSHRQSLLVYYFLLRIHLDQLHMFISNIP